MEVEVINARQSGGNMTDKEIYEAVEEFLKENLASTPFDKGLPVIQEYVWSLGDKIGKTGPEVLKTYFDVKSKQK